MGIWLTLGESWHSASSAGDKVTQCNTQSWIHIRDTSASYFGSSKYIIWLKIWTLKSRKRRSSSSFGLILRFFDCFKFMIPTPTCTRGYHAPLPPGESIQLIYGLLVCAVCCVCCADLWLACVYCVCYVCCADLWLACVCMWYMCVLGHDEMTWKTGKMLLLKDFAPAVSFVL